MRPDPELSLFEAFNVRMARSQRARAPQWSKIVMCGDHIRFDWSCEPVISTTSSGITESNGAVEGTAQGSARGGREGSAALGRPGRKSARGRG